MSQKIETPGTYIGTIAESGLSTTKNGYPQWVARLKAVKKFVEDKAEVEHFTTQGALQGTPGFVDYSAFDEEIMAYLVLFKSATEFSKDTQLLNYEQLQTATGWEGVEFDSLVDGSLVDKEILFRVEFRSYTNPETQKTTEGNQVTWIDNKDAGPQRQIKSLDVAAVKGLNALLKIKPAPKPAAKPAAAAAPAAAASTVPAAAVPAAAPRPPASKTPPKKSKKDAALAPAAAPPGPPPETTQEDAWNFVISNKGATEDKVVEEAWIAATTEVGTDKDDADFTGADWAKVRDIVLKDIAA